MDTEIFIARQQSCGKIMFSVVSVCHSVHRGVSHVTIAQDALELTIQGPPQFPALPPPRPPRTCSNLFNWDLAVQLPTMVLFKLVNCEVRNVGKQVVGILLGCFLIYIK